MTPRQSIRRFPAPTVTAFNVSAGIVLAGFNQEAAPSGYLLRPLLACLALSVVIGAVSLVAGRYAVVASAAVALVVMKADLVGVLIAAIAVTAVQVARITRSSWVFARPVLYGSAVFLVPSGDVVYG